mgnify:CR=1 FL=1
MTTEGPSEADDGRPGRSATRRRPRPATVARVLTTGAALSATGALVAAMGAADRPDTEPLATAPGAAVPTTAAPAADAAHPVTVIVVQQAPRPAAATASPAPTAAPAPASGPATGAPSAGAARPAPPPATVPPPVATTSPS